MSQYPHLKDANVFKAIGWLQIARESVTNEIILNYIKQCIHK